MQNFSGMIKKDIDMDSVVERNRRELLYQSFNSKFVNVQQHK